MNKINNKKGKVLVNMKKKKEESLDLNSNKLRLIKVSKILPMKQGMHNKKLNILI